MQHPTLYKRGATADVMLQWSVWTDGDMLYTEQGQVGCKLHRTTSNRKQGKNIDSANATTGADQAEAEAQAAWTKRIEQDGYREDI